MRFDPFSFSEVLTGVETFVDNELVCTTSAPAALYVTAMGYEVLVGYGSSWDISISGSFSFRVDAPKGVRVFYQHLSDACYESAGEVFTNADRLPFESGALLEVRRAIRVQRLEHMEAMAVMRSETALMIADRKALYVPDKSFVESAVAIQVSSEGVSDVKS